MLSSYKDVKCQECVEYQELSENPVFVFEVMKSEFLGSVIYEKFGANMENLDLWRKILWQST